MGINVKLRRVPFSNKKYFLRVTIVRRITDITREMDLIVHTLSSYPDADVNLKMDVGIEDCLHIEFEYNKSRYHLQDVIVGKIYFVLVRIKIKHMEITIIKSETVGSGPNAAKETDPVAKFEIMDGAPVRGEFNAMFITYLLSTLLIGESIPIRLFLAGHDLAPTMRDVSKKFSVRYLLNLVLVDEEDRRYFKQQEVTLWRKADKPIRKTLEPATMDGTANSIEDTAKTNTAGDHENGRGVTADDEQ
ncbi:vacuolar protein sorting-associated protein 26 [Oesophagostomum dentatum]|uniref:Vacuolar protein sorting-associated protein 26 n=1 Tax=Oesophagostomum dentatum TaxID=61180 RepID=A0A0B1SJJ4_OESDE|nr:vacuolar protein sorting-associated protein 26 [Oesophagostomum dentatum]